MTLLRHTSTLALVATLFLAGCSGDDDAAPDAGETCDGGCISPDYSTGVACTQDSDCGSNGTGRCLLGFELFSANFYPGAVVGDVENFMGLSIVNGYCANEGECMTDDDCGVGGACYRPIEGATQLSGLSSGAVDDLNSTGICLQGCSSDSECRVAEGYACQTPMQYHLASVTDRPTDTYCIQDETNPCQIDALAVPANKCHLRYDVEGDFEITDTLAGQGDSLIDIGPGTLILEFDINGPGDGPSSMSTNVGVACYYMQQRMEVSAVLTAMQQQVGGSGLVASGVYDQMDTADLATNCMEDPATYGVDKDSWTPSNGATGATCLAGYRSYGDVYCPLGPLCASAGGLLSGHNPQDVMWTQPWNNLVFDHGTGAGTFGRVEMAGDGRPDLWSPMASCNTLGIAAPPAPDLAGGAVHCEDQTTWIDSMGSPVADASGALPGQMAEFNCYVEYCRKPIDKVEVPNTQPSRTFVNFSADLVETSCNPVP